MVIDYNDFMNCQEFSMHLKDISLQTDTLDSFLSRFNVSSGTETKLRLIELGKNTLIYLRRLKIAEKYELMSLPTESEGIFLVFKDNKYFFTDRKGEKLTENYQYAQLFSEGLALVEKDNKYFFIDKEGKRISEDTYENQTQSFSEGLAAVCIAWEQFAYIDKSGKRVTSDIYKDAKSYHDGIACVNNNGIYYLIDRAGNRVLPDIASRRPISFHDGLARIEELFTVGKDYHEEERIYYINKSGQRISDETYRFGGAFSEGFAAVRDTFNGEGYEAWYYIDKEGKRISDETFIDAEPFSEGLALVATRIDYRTRSYFYIDTNGKRVFGDEYGGVTSFSEGRAVANIAGQRGLSVIDTTGKVLGSGEFDRRIGKFSGGVAYVEDWNCAWYIDRNGKEVYPKTKDQKKKIHELNNRWA